MNKDVIYIDVDDDITAIISKVKASNEKIVALVPPKRIGVFQSAVNLRLLMRSASQADKRLVLITANGALTALAAGAKMPVARNLQSKPEVAKEIPTTGDESDDVIDGNELPIGMHAGLPDDNEPKKPVAAIGSAALATPPKNGDAPAKAKTKSKVPDFNSFRKRLIFGGVGGVLLIAFLVWAIFFAPQATVIVSAKTNDTSINDGVTFGEALSTDADAKTLKATVAKKSENKSVDFSPSGTKNVGEKATGTVKFSTNNISNLGTTIPAGTVLSIPNGLSFLTDSSITITISNYQNATTSVTAAEQGAKYNAASGNVSGAPSGINSDLTGPTSGGTDKIARVVTAADVQKAKEQLVEQENDAMKSQLKSSFSNGAKAIDATYGVDYTAVTPTPAIGAETDATTAKLTATVTYRMSGLSQSELNSYLDTTLKQRIEDQQDQRVYSNGRQAASFQDVKAGQNGFTATLIATAKVGPQLDEQEIKNDSKGKKGGEIQESLQRIAGIEDVDVRYFPFWVSSVPNDTNKITVQFKVDDSN